MDWFRSWHGAPTDNKWLVIARKAQVRPGVVSAVAWALFDYASQNKVRGSVAGFDVETYAAFSGFSEQEVGEVIDAMRAKNVIDAGDRLTAWDKRQPKREDNSTDRVRNWRCAQRDRAGATDETHGNAPQRREAGGNAPEKIREDTDKKRKEKKDEAAPPPLPPLSPQVQVYLANNGVLPKGKLRDGTNKEDKAAEYITARVRPDPASLALWGRVVAGYTAQWSAHSYTTMVTEFYEKGRIPGEANKPGSNGHAGKVPPAQAAVSIFLQEAGIGEEPLIPGLR